MKKSFVAVAAVLIVVLMVSLGVSYLVPVFDDLFDKKTYSQTKCLTDGVTADMNIYDLAKHYRDGNATVAVVVDGYNNTLRADDSTTLGSGVCIASNGYKTESGYTASKGSYIVTNYHVIDYFDSSEHSDCTVGIYVESEEYYNCNLLWFNKDNDVALLYCDDINLNYVTMKDRWVACDKGDRLDYEEVFTIGTPLQLDYLNRLTIGNIASNNSMIMATEEYIYTTNSGAGYKHYPSSSTILKYSVLSNLYEDVIDVSLGISPGNSGGGCFDANGYLIGLTTLGTDAEQTGGNQMNGVVPIYPIIKVLDRLIENKETSSNHKIYDFEVLGIKGLDAYEASYATSKKTSTKNSNYFLDEVLYSSVYTNAFNFNEDGYYILSNTGIVNIKANSVITGCKLNDEEVTDILDRNDLVYFLLRVKEGDSVKFFYTTSTGSENSLIVEF